MEKCFSNGKVFFPDESCYSNLQTIEYKGRTAYIFGEIDCIVDFELLKYKNDSAEVNSITKRIISYYLSDLTKFQELAQLSGKFFIVIVKNESIELLVTSDSLDSAATVYYKEGADGVSISSSYSALAEKDYFFSPESYNKDVLSLRPKGMGATYFNNLFRLGTRAVHSIKNNRVFKEAVIFWGKAYHRQLTEDDLFNVIGQKLEGSDHALAYSTGIDSHHIFAHQKNKISEICTYYFKAPYVGLEKTKAVGAAHINAIIEDKIFTPIAVDLDDNNLLKYLQHSSVFQIYSPHISVLYYKLFENSKSRRIVSGETGDAAPFCFDNTGSVNIFDSFKKMSLLSYRLKRGLHQKKRTNISALAAENDSLLLKYDNNGLLQSGCEFSEVSKSWPLEYYARCSQGLNSGVASLYSAASFYNKEVYLPAAEPLVLYIAGQAKREINILDPKANLRKKHSYFRDTDIRDDIISVGFQHEGDIFNEVEKIASKTVPDIYKMVKSLSMSTKFATHVLLLSIFWKENS